MASRRKLNLFSGAFEDEDTGQEGEVDAPKTGGLFSGAFDDDDTDTPAIDSGRLLNAIRQTETGGKFTAKGASGETGAFQFMPSTWKQFSSEYNQGKGSIEQTPESEEAVVKFKIDQWIKDGLSPQEIAAKWNSGSEKNWENKRGVNKQGAKYDVPAYVSKVLAAYGSTPEVPETKPEEIFSPRKPVADTFKKEPTFSEQAGNIWDRMWATAKGSVVPVFEAQAIRAEFDVPTNRDMAMMAGGGLFMDVPEGLDPDAPADMEGFDENREVFMDAIGELKSWLPEVPESKARGVMKVADDAVTGMSHFAFPMAISMTAGRIPVVGPAISMLVNQSHIMTGKFNEYADSGIDRQHSYEVAEAAGVVLGAIEASSQLYQMGKIVGSFRKSAGKFAKAGSKEAAKKMGKFANFFDAVWKSGLTEGLEEIAQAELEVIFDVMAHHKDKSTEWKIKRMVEFWKSPDFQAGVAYQGFVGAIGGVGMAGPTNIVAQAAGHIMGSRNQDVETEKDYNAEATSDGVTFITPKEAVKPNVINVAPGNRPTVEGLLDMDTAEEGIVVSERLGMTDQQAATQLKTNDAVKSVITDLATKNQMSRFNVQIKSGETRLSELNSFYNKAMMEGDHEGALRMATMAQDQAGTLTKKYIELIEVANTEADNRNRALKPDDISQVQMHIKEMNDKAQLQVQAQTKAVNNIRIDKQQKYIESLETTSGLETELITQAVAATNKMKPAVAKLYDNVVAEIKLRDSTGEMAYFDMTPMSKLTKLQIQAQKRTIEDRANNADANTMARNESIEKWIAQQVADRQGYDDIKLLEKRAILEDKKEKEAAAAKTQKEGAKVAVTAVERQKKRDVKVRQGKEQRRLAGVAKKVEKGKRTVAGLRTALRKPVAGKTRTEELKEAKADKAARVAAISKQKAEVEAHEPKTAVAKAKSILPKGIEFDAIGDGLTAMPKDHIAATIKDKSRMAHGSSIVVDPGKPVEPQLAAKETQFTTYENLKRPDTNWVVVTSDNPGSADALPKQNMLNRSKLKIKLAKAGIPFRLGTSKFGEAQEIPFVIPGMTKADAKKLSDELGQESFIVAEGNKVHFIKGDEVTTIDKSEMRKAKEGEDYTEIAGTKFTLPFFEDAGDSIVDTEAMQMADDVATKAKSLFRAAAIRLPNGKIYEGASHPSILMKNQAVEDWVMAAPVAELAGATGFVQHDGTFTDRKASAKLIDADKDLRSEHFLDISQEKLLDQRHENNDAITVVDFDQMKLQDKLGTLEVMDKLQVAMATGKYSFVFDKTKKEGIKTVFITAPGQYGKLEAVKTQFNNLKQREDAIKRFEGELRTDPRTGRRVSGAGSKGMYLKDQNTAIINLPSIGTSAKNLDQAMETVVHEHVHALTAIAEKNMTRFEMRDFGLELDNLWNSIPSDLKRQLRDDPKTHIRVRMGIIQVDQSIAELVSYSMAHPEFAAWLHSMPAPTRFKAVSNKIKTMWDALVNLIVTKQLKVPSMLDELTDIFNHHLKFGEKTTRFSKEDATSFDFGENVTVATMEGWVDEMAEVASNALPVTVVQSIADASEEFGMTIPENVSAVWTSDGKLIMVADKFDSKEKFVQKWMHEQVAHQGLRNVFGKNTAAFNQFLNQAYTLFSIKEPQSIADMADLHDIWYETDKSGKPVFKFKKSDKLMITEEIIARRAEKLKPATKRGILKRFQDFIKKWLPAKFVGVRADPSKMLLSDEDIWNMLRVARENVFTGSNKFGIALDKALAKRRPTVKSRTISDLKFMETDKTYLGWAEDVIKQAPNLQKWYSEHVEMISENFGPDTDLFSILLAVTSPQTDVETNVMFAVDTYAYMLGLRDKPGALFPNKLKQRIDENWTSPESMLADLESKNFKVTEFGRALLGDPSATVGDMWMFRAFYGDPLTFNKEAETFSIAQITGLRQKLHDLSAQMTAKTGTTWTPREMQAALWVHINAAQTGKDIKQVASYKSGLNKPSVKYGGKTPLQWIKELVPNLKDGPLSKAIGMETVPLAPISPLQKKLIQQISKTVVGKYPVSTKGAIKVLKPGVDNDSIARMGNAIVAGGRSLVAANEEMAQWYQDTFGFERVDAGLEMKLSDTALKLFSNDKGKVKFNLIRDNLAGFSGAYSRVVRFSRDAKANLDQIDKMSTVDQDAEFLKTANDSLSTTGKIHNWRDQSALNIDRFTAQLEQEFLEKFGGRKARVTRLLRVGSGRLMNTIDTELLQKAMNLYIDSGTGDNRSKAEAFAKKLIAKLKAKTLTAGESQKLDIVERMLNLSEEEVAWVDSNVRPYYEDFFQFAQEHNIIDSHVDNYVKRMWNMPKKLKDAMVSWSGAGTTGFKLTPDSGKQRSFDSIIDGWEAGMSLRTDGVLANLQAYGTEIGYTFANRRFVEYMDSLVNDTGDGVVVEIEEGFHPPDGYIQLTDRGFARPGYKVFARPDLAKVVNKIGDRAAHKFWEIPIVRGVRKLNAIIKSTILSVSMYHHLAGMRSYVIGVDKGVKLNPIKAYRRGLAKIDQQEGFSDPNYKHLGPVVDFLVREGLTLGRTQDWDEAAIMDSFVEEWIEKRKTPGARMALAGWQGARRWRRQMTTGLFGQLFAGLKAESAAIELTIAIKKKEKALKKSGDQRGLTEEEMQIEAQKIARLINADFGGLHLSRMGRNPDLQRVAQLFSLAPDWTESNWRTVFGMIPGFNKTFNKIIADNPAPPGMDKVYRKFWKGIALRGMMSAALANVAVLSLFGDDDDWQDWREMIDEQLSWKNWHKGKWMSVNMDPIYRKFGMVDPDKRALLSVVGHFKDILKLGEFTETGFIIPKSLIKHKQSPALRIVDTLMTGTDWKGARFNTVPEMIEQGGAFTQPNQFSEEPEGMEGVSSLVALFGYNVRQSLPIFSSEALQALQGESNALSSLMRAGGMDIRDTRRESMAEQKYDKINSEINKLETNLKDAQLVRDNHMILEARKDIKRYDGFNKKKARIGFAKMQLRPLNKEIKKLQAIAETDKGLTDSQERKLQRKKEKKEKVYQKFVKVMER
jgi:hypothetical protein